MKNYAGVFWKTRSGIGVYIPELHAYTEVPANGNVDARVRDLIVLNCPKDSWWSWNSTFTLQRLNEPPKGFMR